MLWLGICLFLLGSTQSAPVGPDDQYQIGTGIADVTGPAAEINMMGYAKLGQDTSGIHLRLFCRSVVVVDNIGNRILYITADLQGIAQILKIEVVKALEAKYGDLYHHENVLISATHTHSGPGGFFQYLLYIFTTEGFITDSYQDIINGILTSVDRAHNNLKPGNIYWSEGELTDSSANRSPAAYENNPKEEKDKYKYNTDKTMNVLKFTDLNNKPLAMVNWHAVHCVSMNNSNTLISSDNKGFASLLMESDYNAGQLPGKGPFIAIFSQANEGDSTPNTAGARCIDTGAPCDFITSTCHGKNEKCVAFGPGKDMFDSTQIIARKQYQKAKELFEGNSQTKLKGPIQYIYQNIDMSNYEVKLSDNKTVKTCKPALGYSFGAGTTDGEGASMFQQGTHVGEEPKFWDFVRNLITTPTKEITDCQSPKAILLPVGEMTFPYQWAPNLMPTQLLRIGDVVIAGLPGEFTTMSGRRMRDAITKAFADNGQKVKVTLSGLANTYSNYIATYEEYQMQRYEGGSTMYGPHTLQAYIQQFTYLANNMAKQTRVTPGPVFPNLLKDEITLKPGVVLDAPKIGHKFGDVLTNPKDTYHKESEVKVTFVGAHPRNNAKLDSTYLTVEKLNENNKDWDVMATDANWETKFVWRRTNAVLGYSEVDVIWNIPANAQNGKYRIRYFGDHKNILGHISPFTATTNTFQVVSTFYY
ncbi:unnamed protein product [Medioppia subpectinata]|uniref:Neutral ceramidase n=1 Tax=Medioppia subpectinata TaxID=1979941 RepID=A0A7R9Q858_9ACAR|nr:unnamed protein product [Medioppia subpectinata]CAG2115002.1 unnamed protein product [Medioppia subpectinata]